MGIPPEAFDEDYLYFYAEVLSDARSDADAALAARLIGAEPGLRVLDVPCGEGRIAGRLRRRGCEVVGVDDNPLFLSLARERWPDVRFERHDMRALPFASSFDVVVNWFTSFGYFDRAGNEAQLAGFARALRPAGLLLLETHNPIRLARLVELAGGSAAVLVEREGNLMVDLVTYRPPEPLAHTRRFIVRDGRARTIDFAMEQVGAAELERRLRDAGFADVRILGDDGGRLTPESRRLIALARLPAGSEQSP